jgi:hypothetical protein
VRVHEGFHQLHNYFLSHVSCKISFILVLFFVFLQNVQNQIAYDALSTAASNVQSSS